MRKDPHGQSDDVEKGERLKCAFEVLNKDKKRYERMKNTRNLSQNEQKEYEEICAKLTAFHEKCRGFIKPRKNGPGKFIVQAYVNWCASQRAMANNHPFQQERISDIPVMEKKATEYRMDALPEKPINIHSFGHGAPIIQRSGGYEAPVYEQNIYRNMGYAQDTDHIKNDAIQKVRPPLNKYPPSPYIGGKTDERMIFDPKDSRMMYDPKDPRFEFDPRRMRPIDDMRRQNVVQQPANNQGFYMNGSQQIFQGFSQVGNFNDIKGYQIKGQQARPFAFPNEHLPSGGFYNMQPQYAVPFGMEEGVHENSARCRKEQFAAKSTHPHNYHVQIKPGERIPDTGHRVFQKPEMPGNNRSVGMDQEMFQNMSAFGNIPQQDMRFGPKMYGVPQKTVFPYKVKTECVPAVDKSAEYAYGIGELPIHPGMTIPSKMSGPPMYASTQRTTGAGMKQSVNNRGPWGYETPQQSVTIPAKRKLQGNMPVQPIAEENGAKYSFEFFCEAKSHNIPNEFNALNGSPRVQRQRTSQCDFTPEGQPYTTYGYRKTVALPERTILHHSEDILVDSSINSKVIKHDEKFSAAVSNMYKMSKNLSGVVYANSKLMKIDRKDIASICEEISIPNGIPEEVCASLLIHLDSVLHKTLLISGMIAQSRADRRMKLEDFVHGFKKARAPLKIAKNEDQAVFNEMLLQVKASKMK